MEITEKEVWLRTFCAAVTAKGIETGKHATVWADSAVLVFRERFPGETFINVNNIKIKND